MLQELTPLGLKWGLVLQPHEDKVPECKQVMRGCLPLFYSPLQVYCQSLG